MFVDTVDEVLAEALEPERRAAAAAWRERRASALAGRRASRWRARADASSRCHSG